MAIVTAMVVTMTLTAYTDCDVGMRCDGLAASGLQTFHGACACGYGHGFFTLFYVPGLERWFV